MLPRSLLFSSDEGTSRPVVEALQELEIQVEHCPEIFTAVEKLTSRGFDVIVADWNEGPEASFLLKTSRELKSNHTAFALALVQDAYTAANSGADLVLEKPLTTQQVKQALLTCDEFLARMKDWLAAQMAEEDPHALGNRKTSAGPPLPQDLATDDLWELISSAKSSHRRPTPPETIAPKHPTSRRRPNVWLRGTALGVALFSLGYVFVTPLRSEAVAGSVVTIYDLAIHKAQSILRAPDDDESGDAVEIAQTKQQSLADRRMAARVRVVPVRDASSENPHSLAPEGSPEIAAASAPAMTPAVAISSSPAIPESLRIPIETATHAVPVKAAASLLAALEPVALPEDVAEKLVLQKVQPNYPEQARKSGLQGPVTLQAWIGRDGKVEDLKLVHGYLVLGQAAAQAVRQWRYQPYLLNGRAVTAQTYVTVDFRLP